MTTSQIVFLLVLSYAYVFMMGVFYRQAIIDFNDLCISSEQLLFHIINYPIRTYVVIWIMIAFWILFWPVSWWFDKKVKSSYKESQQLKFYSCKKCFSSVSIELKTCPHCGQIINGPV